MAARSDMSRRRKPSQAPLWRLAWRRMAQRPLQYILMICGVAVGVAMMVSVDVANHSAGRAFGLSVEAVAGRTTHRLSGGPSGIDETLYPRLRKAAGGLPAAPIVEDYVTANELGETPLRLLGVDIFAEAPFRDYFPFGEEAMDDGIVHVLTDPRAVVLSLDMAERHDLAAGDSITLVYGGKEIRAVAAGFLAPADAMQREAMEAILFCDIATAQEMLGMHGRLSRIDLIAQDSDDLAAVKAILPDGVTLETAEAQSNALQQMTAAFELNLTALSLLAMVVGMFLIYNAVSFSVVQRRKLFGILRCLGATGGQLFSLVLVEAAVVGFAGAVFGLGLGIFLGRFMVGLVTQTINDLYFVLSVREMAIPVSTLAKGLIVGTGASVLAALAPAAEAMATTPQHTLTRSSLEERSRRTLPGVTIAGVSLVLGGFLLLMMPGKSLIIAFSGLFILLFGMALLTPAITIGLMRIVSPAAAQCFGIMGRMASRGIERSLSRTAVAIAALMVSVSVIVGVSVMIGSFRTTVSGWLDNTFQADIFISTPSLSAGRIQESLDPEVVELAAGFQGVRSAVTARQARVNDPELGSTVDMVAVDGDVSGGSRRYRFIDGEKETLWDRFLAGEGVMISEALFHRENMDTPPEPLLLMTDKGPRRFPVLAIYYDYTSDAGSIMMGKTLFRTQWEDTRITSVALFLEDERDIGNTIAALQESLRGRQDVLIQSSRSLRAAALEVFDRTFTITAALQLLATVVAFIGVLSALMSLQLERTRELGVLRATGMTTGQMWRLTFLETGIMGTVAGLLALPVGWVLAWMLIHVINVMSFGWSMEMTASPGLFAEAFAVSLAAALLAGIYPAYRLGRMNIPEAIRQE